MSIVLELQKLAIESNSDGLQLLRKAFLVARKLGLTDFESWIDSELNGYDDISKLPKYRRIRGELKAFNPYRGWISVITPDAEIEEAITTVPIHEPISGLIELLSRGDAQLFCPLSGSQCAAISSNTGFNTKYQVVFPAGSVTNIIEQVKTEILSWALLLEQNGILGTDISFSAEEKSTAQNNEKIVNYITNFNGPVTNAQVQQGTSESMQSIEIE